MTTHDRTHYADCWRVHPDCADLTTETPAESRAALRAEIAQLRAEVDRLTAERDAALVLARDFESGSDIEAREADRGRIDAARLRDVIDSALCVLVEGPEVMEPGEATREAKRILSSALSTP